MRVAEKTFDTLLVEQLDRVLRITINRADRRNALSRAVQTDLIDAVEGAAGDPSIHAVVIRGAGKSFCAGYDISPASGAEHGGAEISLPRRAMETVNMARGWSRIWNAPIAVIAQVHGHCLAGGTDLALHCDLVVAAEDATIGYPALRMGGTPPTNMWLYHVGAQWAKRLLFTGDTFTGRMAEKIGFALEAVPAERLDDHVLALATRVAAMGRDIVAINKHVLNRGVDLMGRALLQDMAAPMDSIANMAPEMAAFQARAAEIGLGPAFKERDAPFAEGVPLDVQGKST
ncbi:enoyl-CoA hydratase/isomerase family protein [Novosphingobium sp. G106]|uniref:enoyl-CoA hydratase-related protein n=1 Tax=Novosphingobium sp. G106 TaxID=2849500 RepID=UPI001C2D17F0|nr:enoyl-CoA hydratase-related protein [Novosphingobium sp. G106]MBV1686789.1 enoyl-CoA hydratase/isomerase family protein [Novosphingobium sp. G106]